MRKLLLSAVALLALSAQNAFAINLTFQFDVNSSGPSIYACNAGIKHGNNGNYCYDRIDGGTCTAGCAAGNINECTAPKGKYVEPKNCVCTGEYNSDNGTSGAQGTYRMDFLQANTTDWKDNYEVATNSGNGSHVLTADAVETGAKFNQIFGTDDNSFTPSLAAYKKQIKDMTINLGSEVYGAEYFVDICYRGPQIDYTPNNGTTVVNGLNFNIKAFATILDIKKADGLSYDQLSKLQVKAEVKCIMNDNFDYCLADVLPGDSSGCGKVATSTHNWSQATSFNAIGNGTNVSKLINEITLGDGVVRTPRYCQVRYSFRETLKDNITPMRKWKLQQSRICTYTEITEPGN
jgi:hypothetical protein